MPLTYTKTKRPHGALLQLGIEIEFLLPSIGGYTRVVKIAERRWGDAAEMAVFELVDREIIDRKKKVKKVDDSAAAEGTAVTSDPFKGVRKMFGGKKKETTAKAGKATATKSVKPAKTTTSNRKVSASGGKSGSSST
jgi:hypothetical protein